MLFRYSLRSLWQQRGAALPALIAMLVAVWLVTSMALIIYSIRRTVIESGRTDNVLFYRKGAESLSAGTLPATLIDTVKVLPSVTQEQNRALAAGENLGWIWTRRAKTSAPEQVVVRGLDPVGWKLHDAIRIVTGHAPGVGEDGVLVGAALVGNMENLDEGGTVRVGHHRWPVLGTFAAPGTVFDSELLCDRSALVAAQQQQSEVNAVLARVADPAQIPALVSTASTWRDVSVTVLSERDFNRNQAEGLRPYLFSATLLTFVLMLGAAFATTSTMYALLLQRIRELATLLAIGYTRRQLVVMLAFESSFLLFFGAGGGTLLACLLIGRPYLFSDWNLIVHIAPSFAAFQYTIALTVGVLFVAIAIATIQVRRIVVLDALRD